MKKIITLLCLVTAIFIASVYGAEAKRAEPHQLFYAANQDYEKRDYIKAVEGYIGVLEAGFESGNLYYNIGNSFLKLGKVGHAILCYERARRLIPHDSDLKSNLIYARSLAEKADYDARQNIAIRVIDKIFGQYSLRAVTLSATVLYLTVIILLCAFILKPFLARRFRMVLFMAFALFAVNLAGFLVRYYDEQILRRGVVVQKDVDAKYEPIEKSTTYYTLREGGDVIVLKTRDGWRQIKRPDGKIGWIKREAVEEI